MAKTATAPTPIVPRLKMDSKRFSQFGSIAGNVWLLWCAVVLAIGVLFLRS